MSCNSIVADDFMKVQSSTLVSHNGSSSSTKSFKNGLLSSFSEQDCPNDYHQNASLKRIEDMSQTLSLFKKHLFTISQHNIGKTNEEESEAIKMAPHRPFVPSKMGSFRPPSFLEQELLPGMNPNSILPTLSGDKSSKAQLTIFYSGVINVYDDVPVDKAQAIMLLAGGSSFSADLAPIVAKIPHTSLTKKLCPSNLPSVCKLQAELPIARKCSLQRFLQKRRDRITSKCPYAPSHSKHEDDEPISDNGVNKKSGFTPSPFPSRLGFFFPVSANNGC